ncbi:MAG: hypothetical protein GY906_15580 [bacterium]|nr:hypothetical protein [bacterium]
MADNGKTTVVDTNDVVDIFDLKDGDPLDRSKAAADPGPGAAPAAEPKAKDETPNKFQGKSLDQVIEMYGNLESAYGKQGNELGDIRQLADDILQNQIAANNPQTSKTDAVDADALLADPVGVITNIIQTNPAIQEIAGRVVKTEQVTSKAALERKHGSLEEIGTNPGFQAWIRANPARLQRFLHADKNHDFATADDLIDTYSEIAAARGEELSNKREEQRKAIATPRAGVGSSASSPNGKSQRKPVYSRAQLMKLRNTDPARYSQMQPEIIAAYREKRVVP